jgi:DNA-binding transcriptional ArsR family regulator
MNEELDQQPVQEPAQEAPRRRTIELSDPRALRVLAHPTRLRLVGLLRREGPLTATQAGARIGESPASCSFHLRQLARHGLVEEAGGGRGRERPWRATAMFTSWKATEESAEAAGVLGAVIADRLHEDLAAWFQRMPGEAPAWREAYQLSDTVLHLTPEELEEVGRRVWEILTPFEGERRPGTRPVLFMFAGYPREGT